MSLSYIHFPHISVNSSAKEGGAVMLIRLAMAITVFVTMVGMNSCETHGSADGPEFEFEELTPMKGEQIMHNLHHGGNSFQ